MTNKCYYNEVLMIFLWEREDEINRRQENGQTRFLFLSKLPFLDTCILKRNPSHLFCGARSFHFGPHESVYTPSEEPKGFKF